MKDFGSIKIGKKHIRVTSDDEVPTQEVVSTMIGMKLGELLDIDIDIDMSKLEES